MESDNHIPIGLSVGHSLENSGSEGSTRGIIDSMADENVLPIPEVNQPEGHASSSKSRLYILDYGAGNVRRWVRIRPLGLQHAEVSSYPE